MNKEEVKSKSSINDAPNEFQTAILNVKTRTSVVIFQKDDKPKITFYKDYGTVEVMSLKENYIFSLRNIESIEYDSDECVIYYG
ncbi:hypothetical protein [Companilactobacillus halodurans]|uniref:Uncharacterized protein n=1 Tax=Companilactobacillus halodurans TaxID=2584183 RepID=A0A5P0ZVB9_9LACO|nr:hypothetical protein [Companilactobacillus halodurans]MQS97026.1 hypothetical protein [Companilactobacillus halodurans]